MTRYRLLLAGLLLSLSVIGFWTPIPAPTDVVGIIGFAVLSALLLDLAARFRARDLYALLTLAGMYGLLAALFIFPHTALTDVPRTLFTRALGGHTLMGLLALLLFFGVRASPLTLIGTSVIGAAWGIWAKWSPVEVWGALEPTPLPTLLIALVVGLVVAGGLSELARRASASHMDFRLSPLGWLIAGVTAAGLLLFQAAQGRIDGVTAVIVLVLAGFCAAILWFQKRVKGGTLLDSVQAPTRGTLIRLGAALAVGAVIGWLLPRTDPDGVAILVSLFAAYGLMWLPAVSLVLGARAFGRQARALKL
ncbi:MAG: hypothetical protein IAE80_13265 [Anaerolinea sp.]|nr:hypothetical protein [Anaerolinea sp.]